jgi:hypothetical protein
MPPHSDDVVMQHMTDLSAVFAKDGNIIEIFVALNQIQ